MSIEPVFDIDEFNKPKQFESSEADNVVLYRIIKGRDNSHVSRGIGFDIEQYRFTEIMSSRSEIETKLRNHVTEICPEIYVDSIDVNMIDAKTLYFGINVIKQESQIRDSIFFKITKSDNSYSLVELINNK